VTLVKSARSGFTTLLTGSIGQHCVNDPDPIFAVLPSEQLQGLCSVEHRADLYGVTDSRRQLAGHARP
jgi:hypothetical protein